MWNFTQFNDGLYRALTPGGEYRSPALSSPEFAEFLSNLMVAIMSGDEDYTFLLPAERDTLITGIEELEAADKRRRGRQSRFWLRFPNITVRLRRVLEDADQVAEHDGHNWDAPLQYTFDCMPDIDCDEQEYRRREVNTALERAGMRKNSSLICSECGSHELEQERRYGLVQQCARTVPCICGAAEFGVAAVWLGEVLVEKRDFGPFNENDPWSYEDSERVGKWKWQFDDISQTFCQQCLAQCDCGDFEYDVLNSEEVWSQVSVSCTSCGYELSEDEYPEQRRVEVATGVDATVLTTTWMI